MFENRNYEESKSDIIENKELLEDKELRKGYHYDNEGKNY